MSHELRTPLNAILGYSELVVDELRDRGGGNEDLIDDIRKVHASGRHLLGLITDVLDLTRIEASRLELSPTDFEPARLLREVAEIFIPWPCATTTSSPSTSATTRAWSTTTPRACVRSSSTWSATPSSSPVTAP
ncbi:sensor histidine kinase [Nannocystis pusilla]|uniref:sensor histidine kinase n=1 Tax=Nannocystis pusilla TaxID=889268 RepID=UPI003B7C7105